METFTDDTVVALASFLSPHDMLSLALSCKRFGARNLETSRGEASQSLETHNTCNNTSLMEVAARTVLQTKWTDEEKNALLRQSDESWIGIYQEFLKLFRLPLQFDKLVGVNIDYVDNSNKTTIYSKSGGQVNLCSAICNNIMRAGKHTVSFNVNNSMGGEGIFCGVMRPTTKDITSLTTCNPLIDDLSRYSLKDYEALYGDNNADCCLLKTFSGIGMLLRRWKEWSPSEVILMLGDENENELRRIEYKLLHWEGMEHTHEASFKIGLVLDLDEGTLDVYKNDRRLGTMMGELIGEYCWLVSLHTEQNPDTSRRFPLTDSLFVRH